MDLKRVRNWIQNALFKRSKIPPLPDEILLNIFEYLTPEERIPLCAVCRKFRLLELQIGNRKFNDIYAVLCDETNLYTKEPSDLLAAETFAEYGYSFVVKADGDFEAAFPDISKCFKGASADSLSVAVHKNREPTPSRNLVSLLHQIDAKELYFSFNCTTDCSGFITRYFEHFTSHNLEGITFSWNSINDQNLARLQEAMKLLPKMKFVAIQKEDTSDNVIEEEQEGFLVNEQLMLSMISIAPKVHLQSIQCTTNDLLKAFQIVCELGFHKNISLFAVRSASDHLLTIAEEQGFMIGDRCVIDYTRGYTMFIYYRSEFATARFSHVKIHPIDAAGRPIMGSDSD